MTHELKTLPAYWDAIQRCLYMIPKDDREIFISSLCSKCFDAVFEGMEEE